MARQTPSAKLKNPSAKRGAPYGDTNALKHGFYSRAFKAGELDDLDAMLTDGLRDEIAMLRVTTRRVIECLGEDATPQEAVISLGALGMAATRLATLLKTQKMLDGQEQNTTAALNEALAAVVKELGIHA